MHLPDEVYLYIFLLLYGAGTACHSEAPASTPELPVPLLVFYEVFC